MEYQEYAPPPALSPMVRCCWTLQGNASDAPADPVFPDGSPEIICNVGEVIRAQQPHGTIEAQPPVMLVGQITAPFVVQPTGTIALFGLRLQPFGGAAFHDDLSTITNSWVSLASWLGASVTPHSLCGLYQQQASLRAVGDQVIAALHPLLTRSDVPHPAVRRACATIRERRGSVNIDELATQLSLSVRSLQRLFAAEVGIPPKLLARITRFQHVFAAWRHDPRTLAAVAADCGYFDQSHLVRDFRDFAGEAPAAALAEQARFTALFLP
jgi:AraC-like DNA-binding protein